MMINIKISPVPKLWHETKGEFKVSVGRPAQDAQELHLDKGFAQALLGKKKGDKVDFGEGYRVVIVE
jgi:hypothetical protein